MMMTMIVADCRPHLVDRLQQLLQKRVSTCIMTSWLFCTRLQLASKQAVISVVTVPLKSLGWKRNDLIMLLKQIVLLKFKIQHSRTRRKRNKPKNDDDRIFLLSVWQSIKAVPQALKLQMRLQIMQVVANYTYQHASSYLLPDQTITGPSIFAQPFSQQSLAKQLQDDSCCSGEITGFNYK